MDITKFNVFSPVIDLTTDKKEKEDISKNKLVEKYQKI